MIKTLLYGSAGILSRFTQEEVTLIEGAQELSERLQLMTRSDKNNRELFIFKSLRSD